MRITQQQRQTIKNIVAKTTHQAATVILFGSRIDDSKRGGDVDLLVELPNAVDNPAWLAALLSAKISRAMAERKVDVILSAPQLQPLAIHQQAKNTGIVL